MIRDPRDVILSTLNWLTKRPIRRWEHWGLTESFNARTTEEKIRSLILSQHPSGIKNMLRNALFWMKNPSIHIVRFENLVGPQGGGNLEEQKKAISDLAIYIGCLLTDEKISEIAESLFGGTVTFFNGQQGCWENLFTPNNKALFKQILGEELIQMGYETDYDW